MPMCIQSLMVLACTVPERTLIQICLEMTEKMDKGRIRAIVTLKENKLLLEKQILSF